ncbi:hypothetical protein BC830DRAFT_1135388 [Chytriomyces sp. MP71]|nr:hypothetical protein BC830DRAFT_1135388 [Chytriomyces sp. MP71]
MTTQPAAASGGASSSATSALSLTLACVEALGGVASLGGKELADAVSAAKELASNSSSLPRLSDGYFSADPLWPPFKIALAPGQPVKVREKALDGVQKLIAHRVLRGLTPVVPSTNTNNNAATQQNYSNNATNTSWFGFRSASFDASINSPSTEMSAFDIASPRISNSPTRADLPTSASGISKTSSVTSGSSNAHLPLPVPTTNTTKPTQQSFLIDDIIHTVCTCFSPNSVNAEAETSIQLQVLKVLLTAVTSTSTTQVHAASLLKSVQTCFNVYMVARHPSNAVTAKAALTQMVHAVFSRMERYAEIVKAHNANAVTDMTDHDEGNTKMTAEDENSAPIGPTSESTDVGGSTDATESSPTSDTENSNGETQTADVVIVAKDSGGHGANVKKPLAIVVGMLDDDDGSGIVSLDDTREKSRLPTPQPVRVIPERQKPLKVQAASDPDPYNPTIQYYDALLRRDAYLVLRLLCRLSAQADSTPASSSFTVASVTAAAALPPVDDLSPSAQKTRALALEMIQSVLNNAGPILQEDGTYAELVRTQLAASIGRNAITTNPTLFEFSLSIFLMVIRFYRARMKTEVEVLLNTVYLHILEMGNSTYKQKSLVLQGLQKLMEDPQSLLDIYLNYDCDLASVSIYERIVGVCTRVAQGKERVMQAPIPLTLMGSLGFDNRAEVLKQQEARLRLRGLVCLVAIVDSLVTWSYGQSATTLPSVAVSPKRDVSQESPTVVYGQSLVVSTNSDLDALSPTPAPAGTIAPLISPSRQTTTPHHITTSTAANVSVGTASNPIATRLLEDALANDTQPIINKNRLHNVSMAHTSSKEGAFAPHLQIHSHAASASQGNGDAGSGGGSTLSRAPSIRSELASGEAEEAAAAAERENIAAIAQRKAQLRQGIKLFEEKPVKGVAFFKKHGFVPVVAARTAISGKKEKMSADHEGDEDEVFSIACFLKNTPGLSKAGIGSYLGEGDAFNIRVMHAFVDLLDFAGLGFVAALRVFLQTFRLPGEAQKIDRLMEKFADRYCENNPEIFAKADTAYTLAFSVIMLNTDLHSAHIKNRMDKPAFLKNNRGINDNADLPDEYLGQIFDEILSNEIIMEDEQTGKFAQMVSGWGAAGSAGGAELSEKEKMDLYRKEVAAIQKKSQQLMAVQRSEQQQQSPFRRAASIDLAKPMFATACWPLIATFSQLFESFSSGDAYSMEEDVASGGNTGSLADLFETRREVDLNIIDLCLDGFAGGIRIASFFKMEMEREAFVTSLSKLTGLSHFRDFKPKNVKAIKTLLALTLSLTEQLDSSWVHIIKIISQMERLQMLGTGARGSSIDSQRPDEASRVAIDKFLSEFSSMETVVGVDRIFSSTTSLSGPAIIQFFKAVCQVSLEEIGIDPVSVTRIAAMQGNSPTTETPLPTPQSFAGGKPVGSAGAIVTIKSDSPPRMYLLQKIVEIAHYNMHRIRYEWSQIWRILQPYFIVVGCHPSNRVSSLAVDALRQMAMKFLEREELGHFSTQNEFLKSFERIMKLTTDDSIRHMILGSLGQMIAARAGSIRSGWKSIFVVLSRPTLMTSVATDFDELLLESFQLVQTIFKEYFSIVAHAGGLLEFINCVADYALIDPIRQTHDEIVLSSIQLLQLSANQMIQMADDELEHMKHKVVGKDTVTMGAPSSPFKLTLQTSQLTFSKINSQPQILSSGLISEEHFFMKWFPIFSAFSRITMGSHNLSVRTKSIEALFEVLNQCIHLFDLKCVRSVYRSAILPIFDDLKEHFDKSEDEVAGLEQPKEGSGTIWILGLRLTVDLFSENFEQIASDPETLASIVSIAHSMMRRRDNTLVATGQICMHQFLSRNVVHFGRHGCWPTIVASIEEAFRMTNPYELVNCDFSSMKHFPDPPTSMVMNPTLLGPLAANANAPAVLARVLEEGTVAGRAHGAFVSLESLDFAQTVIKCSVHIELLQSVRDALLTVVDSSSPKGLAIHTVPHAERVRLLSCIRESYTIARTFNANYPLRYSIWKKRLVQQLPNLIKQETISVGSLVRLLFAIYRREGDADEIIVPRTGESVQHARNDVDTLVTETVDVMERYVIMLGDAQVNASNIALWSPVVVLVFRELLDMDCWWKSSRVKAPGLLTGAKCLVLKKQLPRMFRLGIRMMGVDRADVRQALQGFIEKVGEEVFSDMFSE